MKTVTMSQNELASLIAQAVASALQGSVKPVNNALAAAKPVAPKAPAKAPVKPAVKAPAKPAKPAKPVKAKAIQSDVNASEMKAFLKICKHPAPTDNANYLAKVGATIEKCGFVPVWYAGFVRKVIGTHS